MTKVGADRLSTAVLIPAFNEAGGVGRVVRTAVDAGIGPVLVVDDGSDDDTAAVAEAAGARVLRLNKNIGKGGAVAAGVRAISEDVVILLDADLLGLSERHLQELADPVVSGEVDMTRGVFKGGRWSTTAAQKMLPQLNGQRAVLRNLLVELEDLASSRYGIEVVITEAARHEEWRVKDVRMEDVTQITKEEKRGFVKGAALRLKMYWDIVRALVVGRRDH